jgi:Protein of unknown function (DUF3150)
MSLKEKVMEVTLNVSIWTARKYDRNASREVADNHSATDAGRFNKLLIADEALKAINKVSNSARNFHYANTLPWNDSGARILPSENFFNYTSEMLKFKSEFDELVREFVANYPSLVEDARTRLNTLFSEADYPPQSLIQKKFKLDYNYMPMADVDDFRVSLSEEEVSRIKLQIQAQIDSRVNKTQEEMFKRMQTAVLNMAEALEVPDKVFRDSLIGNIEELIELIPLLNFNKNKKIDEAVKMMKPLCVDPNQLRKDAEFRKEMAEKARKVSKLI